MLSPAWVWPVRGYALAAAKPTVATWLYATGESREEVFMQLGSYALLSVALLLGSELRSACAHSSAPKGQAKANSDIDTEHIFGFTEGSDVGKAGDREIELEPLLRFGKQSGSYFATSTRLLYKYSVTNDMLVAPTISFASHNIRNVPALADRDQLEFEGVGAEIRYRFLNRERAPFGFTIALEPHWNRVDATSGEPVDQFAGPIIALLDKELIAKRLYGAINLAYEPEWTRQRATGDTERSSTIESSAALATPLAAGVFVAGEIRYVRKYEGIGLDNFAGEALFVGPSLFAKVSEKWFVSAAWNAQIAGHAAGEPGNLDLTNFERHEVRIRIGVDLN